MLKNQQAVSQQTEQLPQFEGIISFEIPVAVIHKKMLEVLPDDYKHKEILAHAIIGSTNATGQLGYIYNALAGFTNNIDFKVGDMIQCSSKEKRVSYDPAEYEPLNGQLIKRKAIEAEVLENVGKFKINAIIQEIGVCEIVDIDLYSSHKIKVKFTQNQYNSFAEETRETWVNHKECTKWAMPA